MSLGHDTLHAMVQGFRINLVAITIAMFWMFWSCFNKQIDCLRQYFTATKWENKVLELANEGTWVSLYLIYVWFQAINDLCRSYVVNGQLISSANQLTGFFMRTPSVSPLQSNVVFHIETSRLICNATS